jgi:hypothetical protein
MAEQSPRFGDMAILTLLLRRKRRGIQPGESKYLKASLLFPGASKHTKWGLPASL